MKMEMGNGNRGLERERKIVKIVNENQRGLVFFIEKLNTPFPYSVRIKTTT